MSQREHPFYGSATVGERGQVVIPVSARKRFDISPGDKLLVFGVPGGGVAFFRVESISHFISNAMGRLSSIEKALAEASQKSGQEPRAENGDTGGRGKKRE